MSGGRTWRTATSVTKKSRKVISAQNAQRPREPSQARGNRHPDLPVADFLSTALQELPLRHRQRRRLLRGSPSLGHLQHLRRRHNRHHRHSQDRRHRRRCRHLHQPSVARLSRLSFRIMNKPAKQRQRIFRIQITTAVTRTFRHSRVSRRLPDQRQQWPRRFRNRQDQRQRRFPIDRQQHRSHRLRHHQPAALPQHRRNRWPLP